MLPMIVPAMGGTLEDPAVAKLLAALGSAPGKPAKPNSEGYVVAKKHGVELHFSADVTSDRFPMRKENRKQVKYLSTCWLRPEKYTGEWPARYSPSMSLADLRAHFGESFDLWGWDWDEVSELRWKAPIPDSRGAELHPTWNLQKQRPSLTVSLHTEGDYFSYLDPEEADVHAGFFVAWCIDHDLLDPQLASRARASVEEVRKRRLTGRELIVREIDHRAWDGGKHNHVWSCDLSPDHGEFFWAYLHAIHSKELWGKESRGYLEDFRATFGKRYKELKEHPPRWEVVPDDWKHYEAMAEVISERFKAWEPKSKQRRKRLLEEIGPPPKKAKK